MIISHMPGDGNCQFSSLASFFQSPRIDHRLVRKMIVHYIYQNPDRFETDIKAQGYDSVDHYCQLMSQRNHWGDGVSVQAFALIFQVNIWICYGDGEDPNQISHFDGRPHLGLLLKGNHYDRIIQF